MIISLYINDLIILDQHLADYVIEVVGTAEDLPA